MNKIFVYLYVLSGFYKNHSNTIDKPFNIYYELLLKH